MAGVGGFRGVSAAQDVRFSNKSKAAMKKMKFPAELDLPVDLDKVNWTVMKEWVAKRVTELLGIEEEVTGAEELMYDRCIILCVILCMELGGKQCATASL
eukprot:GHRR01025231.1.p1 GENE.GHRR01025231.1~~GHRR01025231.1.p1  ORF type:complete len:100 (+),score=12.16 GHRR01025231.1:115-414(+)